MVSGGRDSGKSFALSTFNAVSTADYNHRILYTRYTLSSTDDSIEQAQINRIEMLGLDAEFDISSKNFKHKVSNGKIVILGQKTSSGNQTAKLKSLEDFSIFITDEAEELVDIDEWKKIKRSMRASDVQCLSIMVFNPPTKAHIIHKNFYQGVPEGFNGVIGTTLYIHTSYLDNGRENMAEHNWNEYEALRLRHEEYEALKADEKLLASKELIRDWKEYKYTILGGFKPVAEGVIYDNWRIGEFDYTLQSQCFGLDFGSNDPDALTRVAINHSLKYIHIRQEFFKNNTSTDGLIKVIQDRVGHDALLVADSENRRLIRDIWDAGFNVVRAYKAQGSVAHTIKTIQGYTLIIDADSLDLQEALDNYAWHDKKSDIPQREYKHLPDSFGYAVMELLYNRGSINW